MPHGVFVTVKDAGIRVLPDIDSSYTALTGTAPQARGRFAKDTELGTRAIVEGSAAATGQVAIDSLTTPTQIKFGDTPANAAQINAGAKLYFRKGDSLTEIPITGKYNTTNDTVTIGTPRGATLAASTGVTVTVSLINYHTPFFVNSLIDAMVPDPITGENVFGLGGGSLQRDLGNLFAQGSVGTFVVIVPAASLADSSWGTNAKVVERWALLGADIEATMSSPSTDTAKAARKGIYAHMAVDPRPRLWIAPAPTYTPDALDIGTFTTPALETELANLAADMRGIAIIDADAPTSFGATFTAFSTLIQGSIPSAYVVSPRVIDTDGSVVPISPYVAGTIAATEANFNAARSPSNQVMGGISALETPIDYTPGLSTSRAQILNGKSIATCINQNGFKVWGNELIHSDTSQGLKFINVTRVTNVLIEKLVQGMQWALGNNIENQTFELIAQTVNADIERMVGDRMILGGRCFASRTQNTKAALKDGKAVFSLQYTPMYPLRELVFDISITDDFLETVIAA